MVRLLPDDVATKEVLEWKGLHLLHAYMSSCSQKLRIFMNLKGLDWVSHPVDLLANEHLEPYFLGINPRGVVPVLIDDGTVHIESNDILLLLEQRYPEPQLMPVGGFDRIAAALKEENDLHFDLRTLTFRFMLDPGKPPKSERDLERYARNGTGNVQGQRDPAIDREITFWRNYLAHGINDETARRSAQAFYRAFSLIDDALMRSEYLMGNQISLLDVAWLVYAQRLTYAGYPLRDLHPRMDAWRARLLKRSPIAKELGMPPAVEEHVAARQRALRRSRQTLADVCFPERLRPIS